MRWIVPILAVVLGVLVAAAVFVNSARITDRGPAAPPTTQAPADAAQDGPRDPATPPDQATATAAPAESPTAPPAVDAAPPQATPPAPGPEAIAAAPPAGSPPVAALPPLKVAAAATPAGASLGSTAPDDGFKMKVDLTPWGAAIKVIDLTDYRQRVLDKESYIVLETATATGLQTTYRMYPFAARAVTVNGQRVDLQAVEWDLLEASRKSARYQVTIVDPQNRPVLRIQRSYLLTTGSYDLACDQRLENLSDGPLAVVWEQNIHGDLPNDDATYLGDRRMFAAGYFNTEYDPQRRVVLTDSAYHARTELLRPRPLWPLTDVKAPTELVWLAATNRYFALATHRPVEGPASKAEDSASKAPALNAAFPVVSQQIVPPLSEGDDKMTRAVVLTLATGKISLPVGASRDLDLALFAGPRESELFATEPYSTLQLSRLIVYNLGGPCAFCTFQWLAKGLLAFLEFIHDYLVFDWGIAIIVLVLVVRAALHPITRKAQINMTKMGKQMGALQPEIEKLKKQYKDDQQKINAEMMRLYREKGINPANVLGCLPMFLQTPIWIALYAMLYYAIELRHQPAFYGLFNTVSRLWGGNWHFLADLSSADHFVRFSEQGFKLNLFFIQPHFDALNIIPLLMIVVFYYQQKLSTPPPANPEQAQQQKIMKFMMLLFPVLLYSAPSGLTLYILASTFAGIVDSWLVRRHIKREEEAGTLFAPKPPRPTKPGGFADRIHKALESRQRQIQKRQGGRG